MSEWLTLIKGSDDDPAAEHQRKMLVKFAFPTFVIAMLVCAIALAAAPKTPLVGFLGIACLALIAGVLVAVTRLKLWRHVVDDGGFWLPVSLAASCVLLVLASTDVFA